MNIINEIRNALHELLYFLPKNTVSTFCLNFNLDKVCCCCHTLIYLLNTWLFLTKFFISGCYSVLILKNKQTVKQLYSSIYTYTWPHSADLAKVRNKHGWGTYHSITPISYITSISTLRTHITLCMWRYIKNSLSTCCTLATNYFLPGENAPFIHHDLLLMQT